ncbi:S-adenosyl-L-methionine-dependent methyltransferase [Chytriomyces cf. hyalinus JEL632]|nr:S-adenosyl-L-methionine-dependent methyltransferase [Chytriomyces cf. hyalinus JEL632]
MESKEVPVRECEFCHQTNPPTGFRKLKRTNVCNACAYCTKCRKIVTLAPTTTSTRPILSFPSTTQVDKSKLPGDAKACEDCKSSDLVRRKNTPAAESTRPTPYTNPREPRQANPRQSALDSFGGRKLTDDQTVFDHNAWDNVEWTEEAEREALDKISKQSLNPVDPEEREKYSQEANDFWNKFYQNHTDSFFMDRHWLRQEFPELFKPVEGGPTTNADGSRKTVFEIGCGAGNTVFPLLAEDPTMFVYAADFSSTAVDVVKASPSYNESQCKAFVYDVTSAAGAPPEIPRNSVDICVCIFVLSALNPRDWEQAQQNILDILKPGGIVLFRDYGRYDMAQLRFKGGRMLNDNFYIRGDGTQVYFFTQEEIKEKLFSRFEVIQSVVDRRLIVNRSRQLKMYRIWMQGKFRKPLTGTTDV